MCCWHHHVVGSLPGPAWGLPSAAAHTSSLCLREGYNNPPVSGENLIGLSRARRPHNAIFVNFEEDEVPTQPLEAAVQTWRRISTNPIDQKVEEDLRKVSLGPASSLTTSRLPTWVPSLLLLLAVVTLKLVHQHMGTSPLQMSHLKATSI